MTKRTYGLSDDGTHYLFKDISSVACIKPTCYGYSGMYVDNYGIC